MVDEVGSLGRHLDYGTADRHLEPSSRWSISRQAPSAPVQSAIDGGFNDTTIRQTLHVSLGADTIRNRVDNQFSDTVLNVTSMTVALAEANASGISTGQPTIQTDTLKTATFSDGDTFIAIPPSAVMVSDPIDFAIATHDDLTVTMYFRDGQAGHSVTAHDNGQQTSWFTVGGDQTSRRHPCGNRDRRLDHRSHGNGLNHKDGWVDFLLTGCKPTLNQRISRSSTRESLATASPATSSGSAPLRGLRRTSSLNPA